MLPLVAGRAAPARIRLPRRRQHRDVHADRQLQSRSGARAGAARAARPIGAAILGFGIAFAPLVPVYRAVDRARGRARDRRAADLRAQPRRAMRTPALACSCSRSPIRRSRARTASRSPRSLVVIVDKSPSQSFGDAQQQTEAARAALHRAARVASPASKCASSKPARPTARPTARACSRRSPPALADVPPDRIAGAILITDGRVHDVPAEAAGARLRRARCMR